MALHDGSKIEAVAENVYTRIIARYSMIAVSMIGFPMLIWGAKEAYSVVRDINRDQIELTRTIDRVSQKLDFTTESQKASQIQAEIKIEAVRTEMRERTASRYSNEDAQRDLKLRDQVLEQHERRITDIERKSKP